MAGNAYPVLPALLERFLPGAAVTSHTSRAGSGLLSLCVFTLAQCPNRYFRCAPECNPLAHVRTYCG
jgi:hypothetical protein